MSHQVRSHFLIDFGVWLISRFENKDGVSRPDNMASSASVPGLKPLVSKRFETKPGAVEGSCLLSIAHPPLKVVKLEEPPPFRLWPLVRVVGSNWTIVIRGGRHLSLL